MKKRQIKPAVLTREEAADYVGISESTWKKMIREDVAPKPREISSNRVGWLVREIDEWLESRPVSNKLPPENCGRSG